VAALDVELNDELLKEGLAREFVRRVQDLRRQADLNVDDHIMVEYKASPQLAEALVANAEYIKAETLANELNSVDEPSGQAQAKHSFDGQSLQIALKAI
jgi:isoleucyl-tRNA synthetase